MTTDSRDGWPGPEDHVFPVRIYYEDTDAGGIVYHAAYLRFAERARTEWLRQLGYSNRDLAFAVVDCTLRYHHPAGLDDALEVCTRPLRVSGATISLAQSIWRASVLLVTIRIRIARLGENGRPRRVPAQLRHVFAQLQGNTREG
ncbi:MAG: YbgC/FadM family acyl-CoA thioesterase [Alphaproteobacteria bacterium]|nr:YbgC/FadM family acyl-CoA thioesterase [Alphaproteobacteria bacterium]MCY4231870.1 YbgC/FadM family acyl-CoA thioesterase [Alphaproteobacteria bacterium]MCY4317681.1 YbgC/FadM family acyl-CoA thioesterase [Alphaproteobacteria bacterium]